MNHDLIVEQLLARCKGFIETILQASDLHCVATASLAIFEQIRPVAREILQAKMTVEAQQLKGTALAKITWLLSEWHLHAAHWHPSQASCPVTSEE